MDGCERQEIAGALDMRDVPQSGCERHTVRVREPHNLAQGYGDDQVRQLVSVEIERCDERAHCEVRAGRRLTQRLSQRRLTLEFMDGSGYTMFIDFGEPLLSRRGSAFDR